MMFFRTNVLILIAACTMSSAAGQVDVDAGVASPLPRVMAAIYADAGVPIHLFADNMHKKNGWGMGGEVLYKIKKHGPVWSGVGVHSFMFDTDALEYSQQIDGQDYLYKERTSSRLFAAHAILRFQPEFHFGLQPYIQGACGVNWFFTNTKVRDTQANEIVDRINEGREAVMALALIGGIHVIPESLPDVRGDLRVGYYHNASVGYMRLVPDLGGPNAYPIDNFERKVSAVDFIGIQVGVAVMIRGYE